MEFSFAAGDRIRPLAASFTNADPLYCRNIESASRIAAEHKRIACRLTGSPPPPMSARFVKS
ncbi:hypothetical protein [Rhizobium tumorigenes]|uniref:hypothetical protein n=1 Tax=Rhizobium tumorigenes TaxID=2041385 RepID=UPI00241F51AB|nr:hypothetical protein [Rhizobium tumorigenes]WFS00186.1 hypothetical protein PR016_13650 [Rhizobium tumorigenes]